MDTFGGLGVMLIAVFELMGIMWIYGVNRFCDNLQFMNGFKPGIVFKVCWVLIAPIMLAVSLLKWRRGFYHQFLEQRSLFYR